MLLCYLRISIQMDHARVFINIGTYWNPVPQPNGPKQSSEGRHDPSLQTPLRLAQPQGNDTASFTLMKKKCFSSIQIKTDR